MPFVEQLQAFQELINEGKVSLFQIDWNWHTLWLLIIEDFYDLMLILMKKTQKYD